MLIWKINFVVDVNATNFFSNFFWYGFYKKFPLEILVTNIKFC